MTTAAPAPAATPAARSARRPAPTPAQSGLPDPRPVTDYTVSLGTVGGKSRLTVTLSQPCVVRTPNWAVIDCTAGARVYPSGVTVVSNTTFYFDYSGLLSPAVAFVEVPYQDMQVQNSLGGFVAPGGRWFRMPVIS